ncbi:MAG: hypothetical protein DMF98_02190 [Acidobacteria bacterium]|nr:MAG: hypothetical protein DMF98_02190 [Acidobacteriota bacterium]
MSEALYPCPCCCGYWCSVSRPGRTTSARICFWEDDLFQLEIERHIEPRKPRIQHRGRRQPGRAVGDGIIRLVVRRSHVAVEQIVEVDRHVRPGPADSEDLAESDVEGVEAIGIRVPRQ